MQLNGNHQIKVVVSEDVFEIAKQRLKDKMKVYEHYLSANAHPEDDDDGDYSSDERILFSVKSEEASEAPS